MNQTSQVLQIKKKCNRKRHNKWLWDKIYEYMNTRGLINGKVMKVPSWGDVLNATDTWGVNNWFDGWAKSER